MIDLDAAVAGVTGTEDWTELGPVNDDLDWHTEASTREPGILEMGPIMGLRIRILIVVVVVVLVVFVFGFVIVLDNS